MRGTVSLLEALGVERGNREAVAQLSRSAGVSRSMLEYLDDHHKLPTGNLLTRLCSLTGTPASIVGLRMGILDHYDLDEIASHAEDIAALLAPRDAVPREKLAPTYQTELGELYRADCMEVLTQLDDGVADLVFADPPFNLKKLYPSGIDDDLREQTYLRWCEDWLRQCARVLKPGGSLFLWNLPKWNARLAEVANRWLTFRHWIAVDIKYTLPIGGRLYPSHYSLLYYCKGKSPRVFHPDRLPMEICPHCYGDLRDYGGYKAKMNPAGVNLSDVWFDISPVRHRRHKKRTGANELPIQLLDRVLELASEEYDLVVDPFGGAGTTYAVAEIKRRRWIGCEIGPVDDIIARLDDIGAEAQRLQDLRSRYNCLFTEECRRARAERGLWTVESVRNGNTPGDFQLALEVK